MKALTLIFFTLFYTYNFIAQTSDKAKVGMSMSLGFSPMDLTVIDDGTFRTTLLDGRYSVPTDPMYSAERVFSLSGDVLVHLTTHFPILKKENWSTGINAYLGIGSQFGILNAEGMTSLAIDGPIMLYYKNDNIWKGSSFFVGYRYRLASFSREAYIIGIKKDSFEFYITPFPSKYYYLTSNNTYIFAAKVWEWGIRFHMFWVD